jgi:hypothetical protein
MTTDAAEAEAAAAEDPGWPEGPDRQYYGYVIIEWPAPRRSDGIPRMMPAWGCTILDAGTGKPITTVEKITVERVTADAQSFITADLAARADPDGNPVLFPGEDGHCPVYLDEQGRIRTGVFPFIVAEMRVRS